MKRLQLDHRRIAVGVMSLVVAVAGLAVLSAQDDPLVKSEPLPDVIARTQKEKPSFAKRQLDLLNARYDLSNRPATGVTMTRGQACSGWRSREAAGEYDVVAVGGNVS